VARYALPPRVFSKALQIFVINVIGARPFSGSLVAARYVRDVSVPSKREDELPHRERQDNDPDPRVRQQEKEPLSVLIGATLLPLPQAYLPRRGAEIFKWPDLLTAHFDFPSRDRRSENSPRSHSNHHVIAKVVQYAVPLRVLIGIEDDH